MDEWNLELWIVPSFRTWYLWWNTANLLILARVAAKVPKFLVRTRVGADHT